MPKIILKSCKEKAIKNHHHWIFSGAILKVEKGLDGDIYQVESSRGEILGHCYYNCLTSIAGRMLNFSSEDPLVSLEKNIKNAIYLRKQLIDESKTNAYRIINSEGDFIPGLIVDKYNDVLVIQVATLGIDKLKNFIVDVLVKELKPISIYEKSDAPGRKEDFVGVCHGKPLQENSSFEGLVYGKDVSEVEILENNLKFIVDIKNSQKTGFFLDQREMRKFIRELSSGKKVLNCFSYTGGFSVYCASNGAVKVDSVDISESAIALAKRNFEINNLEIANDEFFAEDVFKFLRENDLSKYDIIVLDPPPFAKKKSDIMNACRGYKDINRLAISKAKPNSIILTCSCSYYVDEILFQQVIFQAASDAGRNVRIIQKHHMAEDHPINIFHKEGDYLKSLVLWVE